MPRRLTPELMDDPGVARDELARSLGYIRWVNRRLGGWAALLACLERWSRSWPRDRAVTLLDVGTGSADIPLAARRWGLARGFDLRITGIDNHQTTLALALEHVGHAGDGRMAGGIQLVACDARQIEARFGHASFDYVHAGLFLHHLPEAQVVEVLGQMSRVARAGVVWNDLHRSGLQRALVRLMVLGTPAIVRHDARVSVEAGFTRAEALGLARRAGVPQPSYRRPFGWYRFTLSGSWPPHGQRREQASAT